MRDAINIDTCPLCQKCERWQAAPDYIHDPWLLWDKIPCPPPGSPKTQLLVQLDWTRQLGRQDGCKALQRVASRCHVDLTRVDIPVSLSDCDGVYTLFGLCGTQCVIAIILACICLMFVFILAIVCYRYVHRTDKRQQSTCFKVVNKEDQNALKTKMSRYYVQSQYYYKVGNIPDRRGLPYEARCTENGVEARLLRSIKQVPLEGYHFDDTCIQCRHAASIQSTLSSIKSRQGSERISWQNNVDAIHRRGQFDRQRSIAGSSSDMSHCYEYISDTTQEAPYGRNSNHSITYFPRNSSINFREVSSYYVSNCSDDDRVIVLSRCTNAALDLQNNPQREIHLCKANTFTRHYNGNYGRNCDVNVYHGSLKDQCHCTDIGDPPEVDDSQHIASSYEHSAKCSKQKCSHECVGVTIPNGDCSHDNIDGTTLMGNIQGYKYTYNPSYDEETRTNYSISKNDQSALSSLSCAQSEAFEEISSALDNCPTNFPNPNCIKENIHRKTKTEQQ